MIGSVSLRIFRWVNLLPLPNKDNTLLANDVTKIIEIESRNNAISRGIYLNPKIGDLPHDLLQDIFKCQFFKLQKEAMLNKELDILL